MPSIRENIITAATSRLELTTGISGRVYRSRAEAASRGAMPCIVVTPISDPAELLAGMCKVDRRLTLRVAVLIHSDTPDQAADPILIDLHKRLMPTTAGTTDVTLGGLAQDVQQQGDNFEFADSDGVIVSDYLIQYRHSEGDISV